MNVRPFLPLLAAAALPVYAQEPAAPEPTPAPEAAAQAPAAEPAPAEAPLLDPLPAEPGTMEAEPLAPLPSAGLELPRLRAPSEPPTEAEVPVDTIEDRVKFRKARTKALADPKVIAARENAQNAATDAEQRAALKEYYTLLFARIRKIDPTIDKPLLNAEEEIARRLDPVTAREQDRKEKAEKKRSQQAASAAQ